MAVSSYLLRTVNQAKHPLPRVDYSHAHESGIERPFAVMDKLVVLMLLLQDADDIGCGFKLAQALRPTGQTAARAVWEPVAQ